MKDIKIHKQYYNRLCSIKGIEYNYSDKLYFSKLFYKHLENTGFVFFYFDKQSLENGSSEMVNQSLSWEGVTNRNQSYMFFRGIEEDVIWIARSSDIDFIFI